MQQLVYALNDIKRDLNVLTQKLAVVDRVIKTGNVTLLMSPITGGSRRKRNRKGGVQQNTQYGQFGGQFSPQVFGQQQGISSGLWGASPGSVGGGRRRNRKRNRQQGTFGGQQFANGAIPPHIAQSAALAAQYLQQMQGNGVGTHAGT